MIEIKLKRKYILKRPLVNFKINKYTKYVLSKDMFNLSNFLWDMNNSKLCHSSYIEFRQSFAKETFSYDELLKK